MTPQQFVRLSQVIGLATAIIGFVNFTFGWVGGSLDLLHLTEMRASSSLGFFCLGLALFASQSVGRRRVPSLIVDGALAILVLVASVALYDVVTKRTFFLDAWSFGAGPDVLAGPRRNPALSALEFLLLGMGLFCSRRPRGLWLIGTAVTSTASGIALLSIIGYVYGADGIHGWFLGGAISPLSSACLYVLGLSILSVREEEGLPRVLGDTSPGGALARRLLPTAVLVPVALGGVCLWAQRAGYFGTEVGLALLVTAIIAILSGLVSVAALQLQAQDKTRSEAEARLQTAHDARFALVEEQTHELRRSELRYRTLVNRLPNALVLLFDRDLRCIYMDGEELMKTIGVRREDFEGHFIIDKMSAANRPVLEPAYLAALQGESRTAEMLFGQGRSGSVRTTPVRDESGEIIGGFSLTYDVTDLRATEAKLRQTLAIQRAILDSAGTAIIATTPEGIVSEFNPAATQLLGYSQEEAVGRLSLSTFHLIEELEARAASLSHELRLHVDGPHEALVAKARTGATDEKEWTCVRKDGSQFPARLSVTALKDSTGAVTGFLGMATDITERRQTINELIRAADLAEEAVRSRSDFLARMSHEIRTPMNGVLGMTELTLQTQLTSEQRSYVETARSSAASLLSLINDILDFSKIDAGRLQLERIPFSLRDTAAHVVRGLAPRAHGKGVEMLIRIPADVPDGFLGDPGRVQQILTNLISNAIKFTDRGEICLEVTAKPAETQDYELEFLVRDTGIGIAPEKIAGLFEAFAQADAATARKYGGTGLGLAICSQLAKMMEGRAWVESALGEGSRFHVSITLPGATEGVAPWRTDSPSLNAMRALVVDDHAGQRDVLAELMTGWRMRPTGVPPSAALRAVEEAHEEADPFSLLLVDAEMPEVDSVALIDELRHANEGRTPLILLTLGTKPPVAALEARLRPMAHLSKPVSPSQLLETIEALVAGRHPEGTVPRAVAPRRALRPLSVLVAEDNLVNQRVAQALLEKAGHKVKVVEDGRKALAAVARENFDVILMDVQMPEMDGLEATRTLRAGERGQGTRHIPIIALTAQAMKGDAEICLAAGMDAYVSKPLDLPTLLETIEKVTDSTPSPPAPAFDREKALAIIGDRQLLLSMVPVLREELPGQLDQLRRAVAAQNAEAIAAAGHSLQGSLTIFAAGPSATLVIEMEKSARAGTLSGLDELMTRLEQETARLESELAQLE